MRQRSCLRPKPLSCQDAEINLVGAQQSFAAYANQSAGLSKSIFDSPLHCSLSVAATTGLWAQARLRHALRASAEESSGVGPALSRKDRGLPRVEFRLEKRWRLVSAEGVLSFFSSMFEHHQSRRGALSLDAGDSSLPAFTSVPVQVQFWPPLQMPTNALCA
jgi:hypothetical protein